MSSIRAELLEVPAMADALGCAEETVEEMLRMGKLPGAKYGRGWVTTREALLAKVTQDALANCAQKPVNVVPMTPKAKSRRHTPPVLKSA